MTDNRKQVTNGKRKTASQRRREARTELIRRWDQLADDVWHLEQAIRRAPPGTFAAEELSDARHALGETVWGALLDNRPRLPASADRRMTRGRKALADSRRELLRELTDEQLAEFVNCGSLTVLRMWLNGEQMQ